MKTEFHSGGPEEGGRFPILPDPALSPLARWLSQTIAADYGNSLSVRLTVALAVQLFEAGHTCLKLEELAGLNFPTDEVFEGPRPDGCPPATLPSAKAWRQSLLDSGACEPFGTRDVPSRPLQYHEDETGFSVALSRLASREMTVALKLAELAANPAEPDADFPDDRLNLEQRAAVCWAVKNRLTLISGGPGTGKTTTVARLVARLLAEQPSIVVKMAAPSGKAAARLTESFRKEFASPSLPADYIVEDASTIHRLLGVSRDGQSVSRNASNPLAADCVIIDEASMVSTEQMNDLLDALGPASKLVLLGDKNQLKSVDPGNVMGAICRQAERPDSAFKTSIHILTKSYRFDVDKSTGRLAQAIIALNPDAAIQELRSAVPPLVWIPNWNPSTDAEPLYRAIFAELCQASSPRDALMALDQARILCSQNAGRYGTDAVNSSCSDFLARAFPGTALPQPIIISENDYDLELFNGDTGIILTDPVTKKEKAFFRSANTETSGVRELAVGLLPAHAPAYAISIHKSQGSEYRHLAIVLPPYPTRTLSRSLLYTAVTRFRETDNGRLFLAATETILRTAIGHENEYASLFPTALERATKGLCHE